MSSKIRFWQSTGDSRGSHIVNAQRKAMSWKQVRRRAMEYAHQSPPKCRDGAGERGEEARKGLASSAIPAFISAFTPVEENIERSSGKILEGVHVRYPTFEIASCIMGLFSLPFTPLPQPVGIVAVVQPHSRLILLRTGAMRIVQRWTCGNGTLTSASASVPYSSTTNGEMHLSSLQRRVPCDERNAC